MPLYITRILDTGEKKGQGVVEPGTYQLFGKVGRAGLEGYVLVCSPDDLYTTVYAITPEMLEGVHAPDELAIEASIRTLANNETAEVTLEGEATFRSTATRYLLTHKDLAPRKSV